MSVPEHSILSTTKSANESGYSDLRSVIERERNIDAARSLIENLKQKPGDKVIIGVYNNKGGVLKSTITGEVGHMCSDMGINTLLIDMDSQCSLTENLLRVEEPSDKIDINDRVRDRNNQPLQPGLNYSIYDSLTWQSRPRDGIHPREVTPIELRAAGDHTTVDCTTPPNNSAATLMQKHLNQGRSNHVGSLHIIIGHHNTSAISSKLAVARLTLQESMIGFHGDILWVIKKAMENVDARVAFVDLNPDSSEANRTIMMQSTYILIPTWADKDGAKCMVDLKCRIMAGLNNEVEANHSMTDYRLKNQESWAQIHADLINHTSSVSDQDGIPRRVLDTWPKLIGLVINSKETRRDLQGEETLRCFQAVMNRYESMVNIFSDPSDRGMHVARHEGGNLRRRGIGYYHALRMSDVNFQRCHGGIWNTESLKIIAGKVRKPMSQLDINDLEGDARLLSTTAEVRHRVHMITRSILHNIALDRHIDTTGILHN